MHRIAAWLQRRFPVLHPGLPEIVAWCDGRSDPADARRIALHLVSCARCRMHVELLYEGRRRLLHSSSEPRRPPYRPSLSFLPADVNRLGATR